MMTDNETTEGMPPKNELSPFNFPDLTIKIGKEKLYINRDHLMEVSPVFREMLTEKNPSENELPDKDPTTFALFLKHTLPGFDGLILPVVQRHQVIRCTEEEWDIQWKIFVFTHLDTIHDKNSAMICIGKQIVDYIVEFQYIGYIKVFIFMEGTSKKMRTEVEAENVRLPKNTLSPFNFQDFTIEIGNEKIFVNKDNLMEASPVFQKMLTGNFKEKDANQITLPHKDPTTFAIFLRHTLPGFDGLELQEATAHLILPLAHEYQTNTTLSKIDQVLAACVEQREYKCDKKLTDEILTAELYNLQQYVTACIEKASVFSHKALIKNPKFHDISSDTKSEIFLNLCKEMEVRSDQCVQEMEVRIDQCIQEMEVNARPSCGHCNSSRRFVEASDKLKLIRKASGPRFWLLK